MKVTYLTAFAISSMLTLGTAVIPPSVSSVSAAPCAPANPGAAVSQTLAPSIFAEDGIAIRGADPVAYFIQGGPIEGSTEFAYEWNGATWLFSSALNRARFISNPEAYAPQYGGYCAYAASEGNLASTVPEAWKIVDGKLYLNYSLRVQQLWSQDIPGNIIKADANWPGILAQASR